MPSIAQQDYLRPQGKSLKDCHLLAALAHNIKQGTIFDTIMSFVNEDGEIIEQPPIQTANTGSDIDVYYYSSFNSEVSYIKIIRTQTQYEGLAAIQDAADNYGNEPAFEAREHNGLYETTLLGSYVTNNGKLLVVTTKETVSGTIIDSIDSSNFDVPESDTSVEISLEDAQKLIGLPCTE